MSLSGEDQGTNVTLLYTCCLLQFLESCIRASRLLQYNEWTQISCRISVVYKQVKKLKSKFNHFIMNDL